MNDAFILDVADNLKDLEKDFRDWQSLQYDLRRKSDDACMQKYGLTNTQFYNMQRANFIYYSGWKLQHEIANIKLTDDDGNPVHTHKDNIPPGCTVSGEINVQADKILMSKRVEQMDDEYTVIPDWLDPEVPDYTLEELIAHYNRYLEVTQDHKDISNSYSLSIWGKSVPDMFIYMKSKLQKNHSDSMDDPISMEEAAIPKFTPDLSDQALNNFRDTIAMESADDLQLLVRKLDCLCPHKSSLYESHVLESYGDKIKIGKKTYRADIPGVVPFLQYDEYVNNPNGIDTRKIVGGMFPYILSYDERPVERYHELEEAYRNNDINKMLEMGWNPVVKPTMKTLEEARERQIKYLDEHYPIRIYDISDYTTAITHEALFEAEMEKEKNGESSKSLKPIYIILSTKSSETVFSKVSNKLFYDKEYSHVGVSFESTMQNIYTFSSVGKANLNRMRVDSIDDYKYETGTVRVIGFFVRKEIYNKMKDAMRLYMSQQDNSPYSFDNAFALVADTPRLKGRSLSMICGSFLDSMFKIANVYDQLAGMKNPNAKIHFYILFTGNPKGYKSREIEKKVKVLQKNLDFNTLNFFEPDLVLGNIQYKLLENFNMKTSDSRINAVLEQIREILTPTDAYLEASTIDPEVEIQGIADSYKLLSTYGDTEIEGMKREVAHIIYSVTRLNDYKSDMKSNDPKLSSINQAIDLGKRCFLNYIGVIKTMEPEFDIEEYIKGTPYADELKTVDRSLFKYDSLNISK